MRYFIVTSLLSLSVIGCSDFSSHSKKKAKESESVDVDQKPSVDVEFVTDDFFDYKFEMPSKTAKSGLYESSLEKYYAIPEEDLGIPGMKGALVIFSYELCESAQQRIDWMKNKREKKGSYDQIFDLISGGSFGAKSISWDVPTSYSAIVFEKEPENGTCVQITVNPQGDTPWAKSERLISILQRIVSTMTRK